MDIARTLSLNTKGADVSALQQFLHDNAGYGGAISGNMGPQSVAALTRWQISKGIVASATAPGAGTTGPRTRAALACTRLITNPSPQTLPSTNSGQATIESLKAEIARLSNLLALLSKASGDSTAYPPPATPATSPVSTTVPTNPISPSTTNPPPSPVSPPASCTWNGQSIASGSSVTAYQSATVPFGGQTCSSQTRTCTNGTLSGSYTNSTCSIGIAASCTQNGTTVVHGSSRTFYSDAAVPYGDSCTNYAQSRTCTNGVLSGNATYQYSSCAVGDPNACSFNNQSVAHGATVTAYQAATVPYGQTCSSQTRTCTNGTLSGSYQYPSCTIGAAASCTLNGVTVQNGQSATFYSASTVSYGTLCSSVAQSRTCSNGTLSGTYTYATCAVGAANVCTFNGQTVNNGTSVPAYQSANPAYPAQCVNEQRTCNNGVLSGSYAFATCQAGSASSCTTPWGTSVAHGSSVPAYTQSSVPFGQNCASETRTCNNGTLSGSNQYASCIVATQIVMPPVSQTTILNGERPDPAGFTPDFYSAEPVKWNGAIRMYFGGWYELSPPDYHDDIYVADCPYTGGPCTNPRMVIDGGQNGYDLNDPSIVLIHPSDGSRDYYIMYTTCNIAGQNGGGVCYSTSWADDGINWGKPSMLISGTWLPSATMKDGRVILYLSTYPSNQLMRYDLGASGVGVGTPVPLTFTGLPAALGGNAFYINVNVQWRPTLNAYQMLAEGPDTTDGAWPWPSAIDYLDSTDGINWRVVYPAVIRRTSDQVRVGTPGQHPDSAAWVYFGTTARTDSAGFKINFAQWSAPTASSANKYSNLANVLTALESALKAFLGKLK